MYQLPENSKLTILSTERILVGPQIRTVAIVKCECGTIKKSSLYGITKGNVRSCGCWRGKFRKLATGHPLYHLWYEMIGRCYDPNHQAYNSYGGRGIIVCDKWKNDIEAFAQWALENGWNQKLHMDREENNGNYNPDNCRFVTAQVNMNNRRDNRILTYKEVTDTMANWARKINIPYQTFARRILSGWTVERAIETPLEIHKWKQHI